MQVQGFVQAVPVYNVRGRLIKYVEGRLRLALKLSRHESHLLRLAALPFMQPVRQEPRQQYAGRTNTNRREPKHGEDFYWGHMDNRGKPRTWKDWRGRQYH